jgi:two-component system, sensor histidine kinase and response regulator
VKIKPKILVVDDQPVNLKLLEKKLVREEMEVWTAPDGETCLALVEEHHPDLILLDVMMPHMDGHEVCALLQEKESTRSIPIIFITANSTKEGKLEGLSVGAVDYITKPIDLDETVARVNTQLRFLEVNRENMELTKRLGEVRRNAAIGAITQGIAHNVNNLLGVVVGYLDLIKTDLTNEELVHRGISVIDKTVAKMTAIVKQLSRLASETQIAVGELILDDLLETAVNRFKDENEIDYIEVSLHNPALKLHANRESFEDILTRLMQNALESYHRFECKDPTIKVETDEVIRDGVKMLRVRITDKGKGVPENIRDNIFEPFVTIKAGIGCGMGLTVAQHTIRSLSGEIEVKRNPAGQGTVVTIYHPVHPPHEPLL